MLDPRTGRASLREDGGILTITIPSKTHVFSAMFMCFWLVGWAFGWLMAVGMLLNGAGAASIFLIGWLGAWTIGGIGAFSVVLWNIAGEEDISISPASLTLTRRIPIWTRTTECELASVTNLRAAPPVAMPVFNQTISGLWAGRAVGAVQFTYGVHDLAFGLDLDAAEAQKMVALIHNRFPQLTKQA